MLRQTVFGLGAYAYTIAAINFGGSTWAILVAILVAAAFAAVLGYFIFYGRVRRLSGRYHSHSSTHLVQPDPAYIGA